MNIVRKAVHWYFDIQPKRRLRTRLERRRLNRRYVRLTETKFSPQYRDRVGSDRRRSQRRD